MLRIAKIFSAAFLTLFFSGFIYAQTSWIGNYDFNEDGGKTVGGSAIFITHQIEIKQSDYGLLATIQSNGFQTSADLLGTAKIQGDKLLIYFDSYGENNMFEKYEQGDLLLTLEKKSAKGKSEILTFWGKFQPSIEKNEKPGKVYFRKTAEKE